MTSFSFASCLTGIAVVSLLSVLLHYLADDARKVTTSRRRARISPDPDKPILKKAA